MYCYIPLCIQEIFFHLDKPGHRISIVAKYVHIHKLKKNMKLFTYDFHGKLWISVCPGKCFLVQFLFKNIVTIKMRYFSFRIYRKFNFHLLASRINNICSIANAVSSPNWNRSFKQIIAYLVYSNLLVFVVSYGILKFQFIEDCIGGAISCKKFLQRNVV